MPFYKRPETITFDDDPLVTVPQPLEPVALPPPMDGVLQADIAQYAGRVKQLNRSVGGVLYGLSGVFGASGVVEANFLEAPQAFHPDLYSHVYSRYATPPSDYHSMVEVPRSRFRQLSVGAAYLSGSEGVMIFTYFSRKYPGPEAAALSSGIARALVPYLRPLIPCGTSRQKGMLIMNVGSESNVHKLDSPDIGSFEIPAK